MDFLLLCQTQNIFYNLSDIGFYKIQIYCKLMDLKTIHIDIKNNKIREGVLYKRSKFLKEWRQRWIVLTTNFLYTFTNKKMDEVTDIIDLKEIKSYKSYLRKDEEMIPPGFKVRSAEDMYYFCARNCNEKWSWLVSLQRLMDYKYVGNSNYNNMQWVKTKGFDSQIDFENGGSKIAQEPQQKAKTAQQTKKSIDDEAQKILKQLAEQQKQLDKKKQQLDKKQASFVMQQKRQQEKVPEKKVESQPPPPVMKQQTSQQGSKVSQLRNIFQNRISESRDTMPKYETQKPKQSRDSLKKEESIHIARSKIINCLFEEFRKDSHQFFGLKYIIDFIVNVTADEKMGYSAFVIIEGKSHRNKQNFADIFIELLSIYEDYQNSQNLMRFIETCVFQMPGLFDAMQISAIQKKLKDFFLAVNDENKLQLIVKNMFIMHKLCRYEKNQLYQKLDKLVKEVKNQNTRNWSRKLKEDL